MYASSSAQNQPAQSSSLNTFELLLVLVVCVAQQGVFTDWRVPVSFALPVAHIVSVFFYIRFPITAPSECLLYTTLLDLLAFSAQYVMQFKIVDISMYKFDAIASDSEIDNWVKLGLIGLFLLFDVIRLFTMCLRSTPVGLESSKKNDEVVEVVEVMQQQQPQYHHPQQYYYAAPQQHGYGGRSYYSKSLQ